MWYFLSTLEYQICQLKFLYIQMLLTSYFVFAVIFVLTQQPPYDGLGMFCPPCIRTMIYELAKVYGDICDSP